MRDLASGGEVLPLVFAPNMALTQTDVELVDCPGCGEKRFTIAREVGNPEFDSTVRFQVVRCDACGMHYTNPRPMLASLGRYYPKDYSPYQSEKNLAAGEAGSIRNLVLRDAYGSPDRVPSAVGRLVSRAVRCVRGAESYGFAVPWRGKGRLLDFGCGAGKFIRRMHALGWDVTGIDFSEDAVNAAKASGIRAMQGTLPHPELKPGTFDVVTMRQALEHVPDPRETLRLAWELLDRGGLLFIDVPNYRSWEIEKFGEASFGMDVPRHLNHFEPATLEALMKRVGLTNVRVKQVCRASWLRKCAKRATMNVGLAKMLKSPAVSRVAASWIQMRGLGNELIATAEKD